MTMAASFFSALRATDKLAGLTGYTYVPKNAWGSIREHGLYGAAAMLKRPDLLLAARPDKADREAWSARIRAEIDAPHNHGPHVFFSMPDHSKIGPKHHIRRLGLRPLAVDLERLLKERRGTRLFGVELVPHHLSKRPSDRERFLKRHEIERFTKMTPTELWRHNDDPENKYYAANVPHAAVVTSDGVVPSKYLRRVHGGQHDNKESR